MSSRSYKPKGANTKDRKAEYRILKERFIDELNKKLGTSFDEKEFNELSSESIDTYIQSILTLNLRLAEDRGFLGTYIQSGTDDIYLLPLYRNSNNVHSKIFKDHLNLYDRQISPILNKISQIRYKTETDIVRSERDIADEKEKIKLLEKYQLLKEEIFTLQERNIVLSGSRDKVDQIEFENNEKKIEKFVNQQKVILKKIEQLDRELAESLRKAERDRERLSTEEKKERNKSILEKKKKYKKMSAESNKLAEEIQKTIARVAAEGYKYEGSGKKKPRVKKARAKVTPLTQQKIKATLYGGKHFEDPQEEVAYILEKISKMIKKGDLQHIDLVAKKLRKAKRIGKGKYYLFEDEYKGEGIPVGGKMKKEKSKREMSFKQKEWIDSIKKVRSKHPHLSYKEAMQIASEKRHKKGSKKE